MSIKQKFVGQMCVNQKSFCQLSIKQMSVRELSSAECLSFKCLSKKCHQSSANDCQTKVVGEMVFDEKSASLDRKYLPFEHRFNNR
jgi:hypothetical protein